MKIRCNRHYCVKAFLTKEAFQSDYSHISVIRFWVKEKQVSFRVVRDVFFVCFAFVEGRAFSFFPYP